MAIIFFVTALAIGGAGAWFTAWRLPFFIGVVLAILVGILGAYAGLQLARLLVVNSATYKNLVHVMGVNAAEEVISSAAVQALLPAIAITWVFVFIGRRAGKS